jgi:hypothetical protein
MLKWLILQLAVSLDSQESGLRAHPHPSLVSSCLHGTQSSGWILVQPPVAE